MSNPVKPVFTLSYADVETASQLPQSVSHLLLDAPPLYGLIGRGGGRIPVPHRGADLLRLTLGEGAVEIVGDAAASPTLDAETWWTAVRETVYTLCKEGLVPAQYITEVINWTGPPSY